MLKNIKVMATSFVCLFFILQLSIFPAFAQTTEDSHIFLDGFNAYQVQDYSSAIQYLSEILEKYPDTPLRDMTCFWLARAQFKAGNKEEAARLMAEFNRDYPDSPLAGTIEEELQTLAADYAANGKITVAAQKDQPAQAVEIPPADDKKEVEELLLAAAREATALEARNKAIAQKRASEERLKREQEAARLAALQHAEQNAANEAEKKRAAKLHAEERAAREKAELERMAAAKAAAERAAQERAKAIAVEEKQKKAAQQLAAAKAEAEKQQAEKTRLAQEQAAMREKAIAEYKRILDQYPGTAAARTAAERLDTLGVAVAKPQKQLPLASIAESGSANTQIFNFEVAQYAAFEFNPLYPLPPVLVAKPAAIPFQIINRGNGQDSFYLSSGFPSEFGIRFAAATLPDQAINQTPLIAPGEVFNGVIHLTAPAATIDGLRISYPIQAASRFTPEVSQSREISFKASAPLLRAVLRTDNLKPLPGEQTRYTVTVLNLGSSATDNVSLRINHPPQLEPVQPVASNLRREMKAALVLDNINLKPGERYDLEIPFTVSEDALADEEITIRADLIDNRSRISSSFLSNAAKIQPLSQVALKLADSNIITIPGQTLRIPVTLVNKGNLRESFALAVNVPAAGKAVIYHDLNRDGNRQPDEPEVTTINSLAPREETALLLEISTPVNATDGSEAGISLTATPQSTNGQAVQASGRMVFSRPVVQFSMQGRDGRQTPGDLMTVELTVFNRGSNLARNVELVSSWPEQIELVAADATTNTTAGSANWLFTELGAGEKRVVKASFRVKPGITVGTGLQLKSTLGYQDQLGNRY